MHSLFKKVSSITHTRRAKKFSEYILPFVEDNDRILDFGCGSLKVAEQILKQKDVAIQGIDVLPNKHAHIPFMQYDGMTIPFADDSFDVTYASFVFHHIPELEKSLEEVFRVTKKRVILLEDVYHHSYQRILNVVFDYGNKLSAWDMNMALNFKHEDEWKSLLSRDNTQTLQTLPINPFFLKPTLHRQFVVEMA